MLGRFNYILCDHWATCIAFGFNLWYQFGRARLLLLFLALVCFSIARGKSLLVLQCRNVTHSAEWKLSYVRRSVFAEKIGEIQYLPRELNFQNYCRICLLRTVSYKIRFAWCIICTSKEGNLYLTFLNEGTGILFSNTNNYVYKSSKSACFNDLWWVIGRGKSLLMNQYSWADNFANGMEVPILHHDDWSNGAFVDCMSIASYAN